MKNSLTPRLEGIISFVRGKTAADVGTDHAYVPIALIERAICASAVASDITRGPAEIARENVRARALENKIQIRTGGGLSVLSPGETEDIIIAGMGGEQIISILKNDEKTAKASRLILQPMNSQYELRHFLLENGYVIEREDIATEDFRVYNIISASAGKGFEFTRDAFYHLPPYLFLNRNFKALYDKKKREFDRVIRGLENAEKTDEKKLEAYKKWRKEIEIYEGV